MRLSLVPLLSIVLLACPGTRDRPRGTPRPPGGGNNCGNGQLNAGELCDPQIAAGMPGACPTACDDGIACTADTMSGAAAMCNLACNSMAIANCAGGDGCCPSGCTNASDDDCSATCGNSMIDPNETCDGNCPVSCNDGIGCTDDNMAGSVGTCSLTCTYSARTDCAAGDGCCPAGCTNANDSDCSATCGNGMVDAGESCDMNCPASCDDGNACTTDIVLGSASTCNVACARQTVTACRDGDGCCPAGCAGSDADCSTTCGNFTVDSGETCDGDCPTSCEVADACQVATYVGSPATCNAECVVTQITTCTGGDGCCPSLCSMTTDSDCTGAPTGAIGDPCVDSTNCDDPGAPFTAVCVTAFPAGYCAAFCVEGSCPTGSRCAQDFDGLCVKECVTPGDCREPEYECRALFDFNSQTFTGCAPGGA